MVLKYNSRKNNVYVKDGLVYKEFINDNYLKEIKIYNILQRYEKMCLKPIAYQDHCLIFQKENGLLLKDILIDSEKRNADCFNVFTLLFDYLDNFHVYTKCNHNDVNLNNFIFNGNYIIGFDFEDVTHFISHHDQMSVLLFILLYDPILTDYKYNLSSKLFHYYQKKCNCDSKLLIRILNMQLDRLNKRRNKDYAIDFERIINYV